MNNDENVSLKGSDHGVPPTETLNTLSHPDAAFLGKVAVPPHLDNVKP